MADDDQDEASKTEDPTPKRMRDAREKGDVAMSREVNNWFMLAATALFVGLIAAGFAVDTLEVGKYYFENLHLLPLVGPDAEVKFTNMVLKVFTLLLIPGALALVFALAGGLVQNGILFSTEPLKPKLSKISPIAGFKRLFSLRSLVEFGKSLFKLLLIAGAVALVIIPYMDDMPRIVGQSTMTMIEILQEAALIIIIVVLALMSVIAMIDFLYQRYEHDKKLRMTKQQVKDEYKQTEGDPQIKARLRQIRTQRARARMMQAVPESDVVVTNPTHYAVALKYDQGEMSAPKVTAKGQDLVALKIRELAEENEIPIVENPPLARALHAGVELEQEVPPEHYQAVAEIIGYVMRLKNGVRETYNPTPP